MEPASHPDAPKLVHWWSWTTTLQSMDDRRNENYGGWLSQPPMRAVGLVVRGQGSGFRITEHYSNEKARTTSLAETGYRSIIKSLNHFVV